MKTMIKSTILLVVAILTTTHTYGNGLIKNNTEAFGLAALAAYEYLDYTYEKGATASTCSPQGQVICRALGRLAETTRLFYNPTREDLKDLSREAMVAFRDFDSTGKASDRKIFVQKLMHILQAILPLLEDNDSTECRSLIQQLSNTIL